MPKPKFITNGDEVIMPAISYISTATAVSYQGATPVFVDVDIETNCIRPEEISKATGGLGIPGFKFPF